MVPSVLLPAKGEKPNLDRARRQIRVAASTCNNLSSRHRVVLCLPERDQGADNHKLRLAPHAASTMKGMGDTKLGKVQEGDVAMKEGIGL